MITPEERAQLSILHDVKEITRKLAPSPAAPKTVRCIPHLSFLIPIGADHTAELIIAEDSYEEMQQLFDELMSKAAHECT